MVPLSHIPSYLGTEYILIFCVRKLRETKTKKRQRQKRGETAKIGELSGLSGRLGLSLGRSFRSSIIQFFRLAPRLRSLVAGCACSLKKKKEKSKYKLNNTKANQEANPQNHTLSSIQSHHAFKHSFSSFRLEFLLNLYSLYSVSR